MNGVSLMRKQHFSMTSKLRHHDVVSYKYWWDILQFFSHTYILSGWFLPKIMKSCLNLSIKSYCRSLLSGHRVVIFDVLSLRDHALYFQVCMITAHRQRLMSDVSRGFAAVTSHSSADHSSGEFGWGLSQRNPITFSSWQKEMLSVRTKS